MLLALIRRLFRRRNLIADTIGKFEQLAAQLDAGIAGNQARVTAIEVQVESLEREADDLYAEAQRADSVAAKLRELIAP